MNKELGKNFIKISLIYFGISIVTGTLMTIVPVYRFVMRSTLFARAHAHLSLIGWVSFAIIGFIYVTLGYLERPMYSERLGNIGLFLLSFGVISEFITLVVGGCAQACEYLAGDPGAHTSAFTYTTFAIIFSFVIMTGACATIYNIYKTFNMK